jgi:hypothetical protein
MAAFDGRFFSTAAAFSQAASFASEAMWVSHLFSTVAWPHCLKGGHFLWLLLSTAAAFDGRF